MDGAGLQGWSCQVEFPPLEPQNILAKGLGGLSQPPPSGLGLNRGLGALKAPSKSLEKKKEGCFFFGGEGCEGVIMLGGARRVDVTREGSSEIWGGAAHTPLREKK